MSMELVERLALRIGDVRQVENVLLQISKRLDAYKTEYDLESIQSGNEGEISRNRSERETITGLIEGAADSLAGLGFPAWVVREWMDWREPKDSDPGVSRPHCEWQSRLMGSTRRELALFDRARAWALTLA